LAAMDDLGSKAGLGVVGMGRSSSHVVYEGG
jgi:hypothetical protein